MAQVYIFVFSKSRLTSRRFGLKAPPRLSETKQRKCATSIVERVGGRDAPFDPRGRTPVLFKTSNEVEQHLESCRHIASCNELLNASPMFVLPPYGALEDSAVKPDTGKRFSSGGA